MAIFIDLEILYTSKFAEIFDVQFLDLYDFEYSQLYKIDVYVYIF